MPKPHYQALIDLSGGLRLVTLLALVLCQASFAAGTPEAPARDIELLWRQGDGAVAQQKLLAALAQAPNDASLQFLQAVIWAESGKTAQAQAALVRMTESFPELPEPYNNLAALHAAAGRLDEARALLETALRLDPSYKTAHENLGDVYVRLAARAYESATGPRPEPALQAKLRLARALITTR